MQAVIFDVDGTLVDNMMVHHKLWHQKLNQLGLDFTLEETMEKAHGVNIEFLGRFFGNRYSVAELEEISAEKEAAYRSAMREDFPIVSGAQQLIKSLHADGVALAIGSAGPPENVNFVLDEAQIRHYFSAVYHSKNVAQGKPNPEVYLNGARDMAVPIEACMVIEDTPIGAQTALNAGCPALIISTTHKPEEFVHLPNVVDCVEDFEGITPKVLLQYFNDWKNGN